MIYGFVPYAELGWEQKERMWKAIRRRAPLVDPGRLHIALHVSDPWTVCVLATSQLGPFVHVDTQRVARGPKAVGAARRMPQDKPDAERGGLIAFGRAVEELQAMLEQEAAK